MNQAVLIGLLSVCLPCVAYAQSPDLSTYHDCIQDLSFKQVKRSFYQKIIPSLQPDFSVLKKLDYQPEFRIPTWDYLGMLVDPQRIHDARQAYQQYQNVLQQIAQHYQVDPQYVVAIWGIESNFGQRLGQQSILNSLSTLSCFGRRQAFFRQELGAALHLLEQGDLQLKDLKGSWAGAFGQTQFMPTTYQKLAVDFDGDGKRDLVHSTPDALASTAHFLQQSGWQHGLPWGVEVSLPPGLTPPKSWKNTRSAQQWQQLGIKATNGATIQHLFGANTPLGLLIPDSQDKVAFLVSRNFTALYRYNASTNYALAISLLAQSIQHQTALPAFQHQGLSRQDRRRLQERLQALHYDIGPVDGVLGTKTRQVIEQIQQKLGQEATGMVDQRLLHQILTTPALKMIDKP